MNRSTKLSVLSLLAVSALLGAACSDAVERCPKCGMDVENAPRWTAGLALDDGAEIRFCSPRCLFAWRHKEGARGTVWVTEYYSQQRMPAEEVYFVVGSDVVGPMGSALVPVSGLKEAEGFRFDHGGEPVIRVPEITVELLQALKSGKQTQSKSPPMDSDHLKLENVGKSSQEECDVRQREISSSDDWDNLG